MSDKELLEKVVADTFKGAKVVRFCSELAITPTETLLNSGVVLIDTGTQFTTHRWARFPGDKLSIETGRYFMYDLSTEGTVEERKKESYDHAIESFNERKKW